MPIKAGGLAFQLFVGLQLRDSAGLLVPLAGYSCESPASPLNPPIRGIRYLDHVWIDNVLEVFYTI